MDIKEYNKEEKKEIIKKFLEGSDEQKYITGIEGDYYRNEVTLMIEHPENGKYTERHKFSPFVYIKDLKKLNKILFKDKDLAKEAKRIHGITIEELRTDNHPRLEHGYKYLVKTTKTYKDLITFFSKAKYNIFDKENNLFIYRTGPEEFLMSTGKRLFKGFETYSEVHKFYFDIETTGLNPAENYSFLIGMKDNRGFRKVLTIDLDNPIESERQMYIDFFQIIIDLKPSIIGGYFSETFDFPFILERCKILGVELGDRKDEDNNRIYDVRTSLNSYYPLKRKPATFKHGSETEHYEQTIMWGFNIIDISHAVKKAAAINPEIKGVGLKYICKFSEIAAENRMYVKDGATIFKIWNENKKYLINIKNNNYKLIHENHQNDAQVYKEKTKKWVLKGLEEDASEPLKRTSEFFDGNPDLVEIITGKEIIYQYLLDDLTETEMVDGRFNEAAFLIGKIAPTQYVRATTMGNASLWVLLMITYSLHNNLAIPCTDVKRDIVGGLSRLLRTGFARNVIKFDYNALYPNIELTHDVFPDMDITGVLEAILFYFKDTRTDLKGLMKYYKKLGNDILVKLNDNKQLPIKILSNSCFGMLGSPAISNYGDNNVAEGITCRGRQYLRQMSFFFLSKRFIPLILDTDGCNYSMPVNVDELKYINKEGKELIGYEAVLSEFNETYMKGTMHLEEDGMCVSTINFSRKNYANLMEDGKIKLTGNSIKSKVIPTYIEEFIDKAIRMLLEDGNAKRFVEEYYNHLTLIYNKQIPLLKIANKKKVKEKVSDYKWAMANTTNKNGQKPAKKAHMELMIEHNLDPDLGEVILFINNGKVKSHGDTGHSYLINILELEQEPNKLGEYNVPKYIETFNKKLEPWLVAFSPYMRESLLIKNPKDRQYYTDSQLELVSGLPLELDQQDYLYAEDYLPAHKNEPLFEMSQNEIKFWNKTGLDPKEIFEHFTTGLSEIRLLTQEEQKIKKEEEIKIINWFKDKGVPVKNEMEFLQHGNEVIQYKTEFTTYKPNLEKETKKNKPWIEDIIKLDDFKWVLSKYEIIPVYKKNTDDTELDIIREEGRFNDIEIIDEEIYKIKT